MDKLGYMIRRSDRRRLTAKQRSQAITWTLITAVVFVVIALATVH